MSRVQQDQFVDDDEEECCPLCVEEFDLSDRNFRPCPCGYQICQFCFNNIKTTMNGLCPACRRPYDESTIEWKTISPEEMAKHKQQIAQKAKKNAQIRQKEAQKAEADSLSRKHLAGLRVVQKNLVYVTGLTPTIREDRLLDTLRGEDYFGQYGKIIKIVVSKARENAQHQQSVGVYVTFARKEDAEKCINAVDGSQNGDRTLRAQYGTTKYCSAYLRGEQCNNRNCMFLHEPGEDNDSFTRQDLSMMNSIQTQQPSQSSTSRAAPPAHQGPPLAAATIMKRTDSNDTMNSSLDAPGLPASANWGSKAILERRGSRSTIASNNPSPMVPNAVLAQAPKMKSEEPPKKKGKEKEKENEKDKESQKEKGVQLPQAVTPQPTSSSIPPPVKRPIEPFDDGFHDLLKTICSPDFKFIFSRAVLTDEEFKAIANFPQLLDPYGGVKRRAMREKEEQLAQQRDLEVETKASTQPQLSTLGRTDRDEVEATAGGSLQLGGEPEDGPDTGNNHQGQHVIAPPGQQSFGGGLFGQNSALSEDFGSLGLSNWGLTPQQQQQLLLSNFKSGNQPSNLLANMQNQQPQQHGLNSNNAGHGRHTSRFSFANDSTSASANVQPVANQKLMSQQNSMMPKNASHFSQMSQHQALGSQFFTNAQGPPPGLKPTSTPPVSGTGMFGQGHGFAGSGLGYNTNTTGRNNDAMYQDLLRNRNMDGARVVDAGKQDIAFNDEQQPSFNVDALVNENDHEPVRSFRMATPLATPFLEQPRRATPTIPPGFTAPIVHRDLAEVSHSRPGARPMSLATSSNIAPAVPVLPATPKQVTKPEQKSENVEIASPSTPATSKVAPATPSETSSIVKQFKPQTPGDSMKNADVVKETSKHIVEEKRHSPSASVIGASKSNSNSRRSKIAADSSQRKDLPTKTKIVDTSAALIAQVEKRQLPEQLDIAAATKLPEPDLPPASAPFKCDGQGKNVSTQSNSIASVPSSPAIAATGSPTKRSIAPRTLRVIPAPKAEVSQQSSPATTGSSLPHILSVDKLRSRQASIASINPPGTPSSELISDTASVTSTSISRANSPPPVGGKIGTAPVRKKTKSQAKKDRQERKRQIEEEQANAEENKSDIEIVQAPIIGRKKKEKKPSNPPKSIAAVSKSHPGSPKPATVEEEQSDVPATAAKQAISAKVSAQATPEPDSEQNLEHSKDRREYTAQSILTELQQTGELLASKLEFFKPLSSSLTHASRSIQIAQAATPLDMKIHFSGADLEALSKKKPVRLNGRDGKPDTRTLITPNGKFFWGLSEELEAKALELEKHIEELKGHYRFHPRKQMVYGDDHRLVSSNQGKDVLPAIATALKEAGKKLNTDGIQQMPKLDQASGLISSPTRASEVSPPQAPPLAQQQQTPADAGQYLNQFVLPNTDNPPLNQPRPEMAAVGGPPGAGTANISVHVNRFARAAKAVVEGGAVGSTEIEGMGMMATDLIGGVFVQGLDALVGAGLGLQSSQEIGLDSDGNMTLGPDHSGDIDVQGLMQAIESTAGLGGHGGAERRGQGSVLSMEEAEQAMHAARKEHDVLEKKLAVLMKKNRRTALGNSKS